MHVVPSIGENAKWYCLVTNPNCQRRAELELHALGYRTFAPKVRKWVSHARVKKAVERPLLGRYLFVEVDRLTQSFGVVRLVNGVETIIANLGNPAPIPSRFVEGFLQRYMAGEWDEVSKGKLPLGARVCIVEGEFEDMLATITQRKSGKTTVKLMGTAQYQVVADRSMRAA
jgi:transcription antitermination factor NusG